MTNPNRLYAKLDKIQPAITQAIKPVLAREATRIVALMKETVPVDTEALKNSIGWRFGRAPKGKIPLGSLRIANSSTKVVIFAGDEKAFYGRYVEFGTSINVAQPFFWNSWRASRGSARKSIEGAVVNGLAKAAR